MSERAYEGVTDIPVLVPARYVPGRRQYRDTFRNRRLAIRIPRRISDPRPPDTPGWTPAHESVVVLRFCDVGQELVRAAFNRELGEQGATDLAALAQLRDVSKSRSRFTKEQVKAIYRRLWKRATGEEYKPLSEEVIAFLRRKTGKMRLPDDGLDEFVRARDRDHAHAEFIAGLISASTKKARLVLWSNAGRLTPAIWCPDLKTAYHVFVLPGLCGVPGICVCPKCQRIFLQARADQRFCCKACQGAVRVKEWRAKQKQPVVIPHKDKRKSASLRPDGGPEIVSLRTKSSSRGSRLPNV
jgi:hypothetical protein